MVLLELVEELTHPVSVEGVLLLFHPKCFENLEVASEAIEVKWGTRRNSW